MTSLAGLSQNLWDISEVIIEYESLASNKYQHEYKYYQKKKKK